MNNKSFINVMTSLIEQMIGIMLEVLSLQILARVHVKIISARVHLGLCLITALYKIAYISMSHLFQSLVWLNVRLA